MSTDDCVDYCDPVSPIGIIPQVTAAPVPPLVDELANTGADISLLLVLAIILVSLGTLLTLQGHRVSRNLHGGNLINIAGLGVWIERPDQLDGLTSRWPVQFQHETCGCWLLELGWHRTGRLMILWGAP
jgi:hypothetical protein